MRGLVIVFLGVFSVSLYCQTQQTPAFPGAEGGGRFTSGGRGGTVYFVNSLEDTNTGNATAREGTLRWCLGRSGAKIIAFKVAGIIRLNSRLNISANTTLAGQTAPGDGICLADNSVYINGDNVIIRFLRFRMGDAKGIEDDAFWGRNRKNIIIDHCSMSWGTDECASFYDNENFTMQWCILSESLNQSVHIKGAHGYGGIWGGQKASFHHNLLAHHNSRNPRMCGTRYSNRPDLELVDFRNNVIYNWGANSGYAGEGGNYNFINNYYKPTNASSNRTRIFQPSADDGTNNQLSGIWGKFYVAGNYISGSATVTDDNWQGITPNPSSKNKEELKAGEPFEVPFISTHSAEKAYEKVLEYAGASYKRDATDTRVVNETCEGLAPQRASNGTTRGGLIDSPEDVGGWDTYTYNPEAVSEDSNGDAIPDGWLEQRYPGKIAADLNEEGYTYLEVYLNSLVEEITERQMEDVLITGFNPVLMENFDPKVFYNKTSGEVQVIIGKPVRQTLIYSLQGIRMNKIYEPGIYILKIVMENGIPFSFKIGIP